MESVFRAAREKLEKEHRERKESGKLKLQQEKKTNDAAARQRQAVEASQRARRLEAIEAKMKVEVLEDKEDVKHRGGDYSMQALPPWMDRQGMKMDVDDGGSDEDSKLHYFAALLNGQGVVKDEDDAEWDKGQAHGAANGN
ncbi:hypothetical protein N665_3835s0004 [Sinapis alba]|nr:hypothetical protein N665_3835s0004 [Sinapis alba]